MHIEFTRPDVTASIHNEKCAIEFEMATGVGFANISKGNLLVRSALKLSVGSEKHALC